MRVAFQQLRVISGKRRQQNPNRFSQLEADLNARLFHRTTRKQSLTETGEIYYQHARRIVTDIEPAQLAVGKLTDTAFGQLHITVEADFAHNRHMAPKVRAFIDFLSERIEKL